ncbi:MAG: hypothetical protein KBF88_06655 [Polyangiaceae bacterium]|nr:hypothetical protein [Polyangiaceae bacterium]
MSSFRSFFFVAAGATSIFAACVLNGQPTPPEAENNADATIQTPDESPTSDSKTNDAALDASILGDGSGDALLDASADGSEGGG